MENIINAAKEKNVQIEISGQKIGFKTGKHVWHWFDNLDGYLLFNHSYSQNTGSSKSGAIRGFRVKMAISKKLGIKI